MSADDGRSSASRLFDDGMPDEGDALCESRFTEELPHLCPTLRDVGDSSNQPLSSTRAQSSRFVARNSSIDVSPSTTNVLEAPLAGNRALTSGALNQNEGVANETGILATRRLVPVSSSPEGRVIDDAYNSTPAISSEVRSGETFVALGESPRATNISPDLPPRPSSNMRSPSVPSSPNVSASDERNATSLQSSAERWKRAPFLVSSFYLPVWVPKRGTETTMIQKRMCRRCKVVVQFKSASLLIHAANCRFTSLVNKKNALDQSRNKEVPEVSWDLERARRERFLMRQSRRIGAEKLVMRFLRNGRCLIQVLTGKKIGAKLIITLVEHAENASQKIAIGSI